MSNLTEALARWDDMTPSERNALVAVHVKGWRWVKWTQATGTNSVYYQLLSKKSLAGWVAKSKRKHEVMPKDFWPACSEVGDDAPDFSTDHNDKTEVLEAFEKAAIGTAFFEAKLKKIMLDRGGQDVRCMGAADWILSAPKDVCRAMLEALGVLKGAE